MKYRVKEESATQNQFDKFNKREKDTVYILLERNNPEREVLRVVVACKRSSTSGYTWQADMHVNSRFYIGKVITGYGYCKVSTAIESVLREAGFSFDSFGGQGMQASERALVEAGRVFAGRKKTILVRG